MGAEEVKAPVPLETGQKLANRFVLVRKLGTGAVGAVWLARDLLLDGEEVGCKFLQADVANDPDSVFDLKRELLLARKLRHSAIVDLHTFWEADGHAFVTMEYIDGLDLSRLLKERGSGFELRLVLPWAVQIADALEFAHKRGVLHRDVKPSNILLDPNGEIRIADFGIACTAQEAHARHTGRRTSGTLHFMSPEQLAGEPLDPRADVYGLAATLYELLAGRPPFHEGSVVAQIQITPPPPIPELTSAVNKVLNRALAKKRTDRYNNCRDFIEALIEAAGTEGQTADPAVVPKARRSDPDATTALMPRNIAARQRLGTILVEARAITQTDLNRALAEQKESGLRIGEVLVKRGIIDEGAIADALERQLQILREVPVRAEMDANVAGKVSREWIGSHHCLPLRIEDNRVIVAMADPLNFDAVNELEGTFGIPVDPRIATPTEIARVLE